jgi:hypothetical protein
VLGVGGGLGFGVRVRAPGSLLKERERAREKEREMGGVAHILHRTHRGLCRPFSGGTYGGEGSYTVVRAARSVVPFPSKVQITSP